MSVTQKKPTHVSLFSGCGGLDLGFEKAGFNRVWANDFDKDAQRVYSLNLGPIDGRDIRSIPTEEIPPCEILTAGFPCQPFSNAGNRKGINDSRGMLYQECLRVIEAKQPKVIVFENVKGLLSSKFVDGRNLIDVIISDLETMGIGYNTVYKLLVASDYHVPQNRERVIIVGIRKDLNKTFVFPGPQSKDGLNLGSVLDIPENVPNQVDWPLSPQAKKMIEMTASAQPENRGIVHPTQNRRFTIREIARIQTFPDDFLFIDKTLKDITGMYKVIGNAVPVNLAKAIADAIMEQVFINDNE